MRICKKCGSTLDSDALFCRKCGTRIADQTQEGERSFPELMDELCMVSSALEVEYDRICRQKEQESELLKENADLKRENSNLKKENVDLKKGNADLTTEYEDLKKTVTELRAQAAARDSEAQKYKQTLDATQKQNQQLSYQLQMMKHAEQKKKESQAVKEPVSGLPAGWPHPAEEKKETLIKKCPKCGRIADSDMVFCQYCGTRI